MADEDPEPEDAGAEELEPSPVLDPDFEPPDSAFPEVEPEAELDAVSEDAFPELPEDEASPEAGFAALAEASMESLTESPREDALFDPEGFFLA